MSDPFDKLLVIDFETRWDSKEYTLSKMTTEEYIRDPRFKAFGLCFKPLDVAVPPQWVSYDDIQGWVDEQDWSRTAVLAHNAQFDIAILSWVYGAKPCFIFDSLSMARALRGVEVGNSLAKLADHYELPPKGNAVHSTNGLTDLSYEVEQELAEYCAHDVFLCEEIFTKLIKEVEGGFPVKELKLIDMTLRMFTNPVLELDEDMLREAIKDEKEKRETILAKIGVEETALASNDQFANVLIGLGCVPLKKLARQLVKKPMRLPRTMRYSKPFLITTTRTYPLFARHASRLRVHLNVRGRNALSTLQAEVRSLYHSTTTAHTPVVGLRPKARGLIYRTSSGGHSYVKLYKPHRVIPSWSVTSLKSNQGYLHTLRIMRAFYKSSHRGRMLIQRLGHRCLEYPTSLKKAIRRLDSQPNQRC